MTHVFTVHVPPRGRASPTRFVPEGFSVGALLLGPLWLLRHGAWPFALLSLAALAFMPWQAWPGVALLAGLCGHDARRVMLRWSGWRLDDVVAGPDGEQAEMRWRDGRAQQGVPRA